MGKGRRRVRSVDKEEKEWDRQTDRGEYGQKREKEMDQQVNITRKTHRQTDKGTGKNDKRGEFAFRT